MKMITRKEFEEEGIKRFGKDINKWRFVCPVCKTVASVQDYKDVNANLGAIGFSCIGRFLPEEKRQRAFYGKIKKNMACDYAGFGLFQLNPLTVTEENGDTTRLFDFA